MKKNYKGAISTALYNEHCSCDEHKTQKGPNWVTGIDHSHNPHSFKYQIQALEGALEHVKEHIKNAAKRHK